METVNPGEFRHKIAIISHTPVGRDSAGFDSASIETVVCRAFAKVSDESGATALKNGTEFSIARRRFLIRFPSQDITTDMFVRHKGKDYKITRPPCTYGNSGRYMEIWGQREVTV